MEILITPTQLIVVCAVAGAIVLISAILCLLRGLSTFLYIMFLPCQCVYRIVQCCIYYTDPTQIDKERLLQEHEYHRAQDKTKADTEIH